MKKLKFSLISVLLISIFVFSSPSGLKVYNLKIKGSKEIELGVGSGLGIEEGLSGYLYFSSKGKTEKVLITVIQAEPNRSVAILERPLPENARIIYAVFFPSRKILREEVVVEAFRYPEKLTTLPAAEIVKGGKEIKESMKDSVADALLDAGVPQIGMGGLTKAIAVRGLARRRSLLLVDGTRVNTDRRTGPSAHFISPFLIDHIEVIKGPTSVFYGSDAIAGVVNMHTLEPDLNLGFNGTLFSGYSSSSDRKNVALSFGKGFGKVGFITAFDLVSADDYQSPLGKVSHSGYNRENLFFKTELTSSGRSFDLMVLQSHGWDIGKPMWSNPNKITWYPKENHILIKGGYKHSSFLGKNIDFNVNFYLHPYSRKTHSEKWGDFLLKKEEAEVSSFDYGLDVALNKVYRRTRIIFGMDFKGVDKMNAKTNTWHFSAPEVVEEALHQEPIVNGRKTTAGFFFTFDYNTDRIDLTLGARLDEIFTAAEGWEKKENKAVSAFSGISLLLTKNIAAFLSAGRAFRAPSLSELYYSGLTGRGYVIGNPGLSPETSYNLEAGVRYFSKNAFLGVYIFKYWIHDMIERYRSEESIYTYGNIEEGILKGAEIEYELRPTKFLTISGNFISYKGTTPEDEPLNDIPPMRAFVKIRAEKGKVFSSLEYIHQWEYRNPGPAEIPIEAFDLLNLRAGLSFSSRVSINLAVENLFDETIFARPDPDAPPEPSRTFKAGILCKF